MSLRRFFGYIELILGIFLLIGVITGIYLLVNIFDNPQSFKVIFNINSNNENIIYFQLLNTLLIFLGFNVIFFILGTILILNGILDIRSE